MLALGKGDGDAHDRMIAAEAAKLPGSWSPIVFKLNLYAGFDIHNSIVL